MKRLIAISLCLLAGCSGGEGSVAVGTGGGASSPTSPAQIPTSVEYAGGDISGDISVQSGSTLSFVVKDASGEIITDPSSVTAELYLPDGTVVVADTSGPLSKAAAAAGGAACYGSVAQSSSNLVFTASKKDFSADQRICVDFKYDGTSLDQFCSLVSVNPTDIENSLYTYSSVLTQSDLTNPLPDISSDGTGNVYLCYSGTYFMKSADVGTTWTAPVLLSASWSNDARFGCVIDAARGASLGKVALGWQNGIALSTDSGVNFDVTITEGILTSDSIYDIVDMNYDTSGVLHILNLFNPGDCSEADNSSAGFDLYYRKLENGTYSTPVRINSESCKVNSVATPRLAVSDDGLNVYIVWEDTRHAAGSPIQKDLYYGELTSGVLTREARISSAPTAPAAALARDINITIDKNEVPVISWSNYYYPGTPEFTVSTYLEIPPSGTYPFAEYLMDSLTTTASVAAKSKTNVQSDFANLYHLMYRDPTGIYYTAATYSPATPAISAQTTPLLITSTTSSINDVSVDYPGRNFIVWEDPPCPGNICSASDIRSVVVSRGKLPDCD